MTMTRGRQIQRLMELLAPAPIEREQCRQHIARCLELMQPKPARILAKSKTTQERYDKAWRELQAASAAHRGASGALAFPHERIKQIVEQNERWAAHWSPPAPTERARRALLLAYELLRTWRPQEEIQKRLDGRWHEVAAVLFGDPQRNLYRQLLKVADEIRSRSK
jgi:hypothetical protein